MSYTRIKKDYDINEDYSVDSAIPLSLRRFRPCYSIVDRKKKKGEGKMTKAIKKVKGILSVCRLKGKKDAAKGKEKENDVAENPTDKKKKALPFCFKKGKDTEAGKKTGDSLEEKAYDVKKVLLVLIKPLWNIFILISLIVHKSNNLKLKAHHFNVFLLVYIFSLFYYVIVVFRCYCAVLHYF